VSSQDSDSDSSEAWLCDQENDHEENLQLNSSTETAVKKLFLFSMHSLKLELGMMLFLLAEAWPFKPHNQSMNT
jgi:hypothetical protein